ncbi:hypothetical protein VE04_03332 [Pseudogymnoascus sp. 24MN13]|nr:hypothetical protein VE04_03332 [Pseudogymnoascus sp. 24MN13]
MTGSAQTNMTTEADGHHYMGREIFKNPLSQSATAEAPKEVSGEKGRKRQASRKKALDAKQMKKKASSTCVTS